MTAPLLTAAAARTLHDASAAQAAARREAQAQVEIILPQVRSAAHAGESQLHYTHELRLPVLIHVRVTLRELGYTLSHSEDNRVSLSW